MQTIFAWILAGILLVAAYPWALWLVSQRLLAVSLSVALATGSLSLVMFWLSVLGIPLRLVYIVPVYVAVMIPGWLVWWRQGANDKGEITRTPCMASLQGANVSPRNITVLMLVVIGAAIVFNAVYWPFSRDDAVAIYQRFGVEMAEREAIVPLPGNETLYEAYPIHIPLTYTFAYVASGWTNEYLARVFPALLSLGCLAAAYILGEMLKAGAGWPAAFLLAITPTFGRWASSGYVDLPMAFLITLAAIFAWRLWQSRMWTDALLAGAMMGLAAWTKNAALVSVGSLVGWLALGLLWRRIGRREAVIALVACAVVGAPWYVRNVIEAGILIPDTVWTEQARASLDNLLILPRLYGVVGVVLLAGVVITVIDLARRKFNAPEYLLLLGWSVPLFLAWWIFASYDPRFILLILPVLCVISGLWLQRLGTLFPERLALVMGVVVLVMGAYTVWNSIEFKGEILRDPLMGDAAKHEIVEGN